MATSPDELQDMASFPAYARFVGREEELSCLIDCVQRVRDGEFVAVAIEGESGMGKTALLRRFRTELEDFTTLQAGSAASEIDLPFGVIGNLLTRLPRAWLARYGLLSELVTTPMREPCPTVSSVGVQLSCLIGELLDGGPVALLLDDLQWADWQSARALKMLLGRVRDDRVLLVTTVGTGLGEPQLPGGGLSLLEDGPEPVHVSLRGLSTADVTELAQWSGGRWRRRTLEQLRIHTAGNPMYVTAVLADARATGTDDLQWVTRMPASLAVAVQRRLERLDPGSRRLVEALAVFDAWVSLDAAAQVAELEDPDEAVRRLSEAGWVKLLPVERAEVLRISHSLQREAVYTALSPVRRRSLHAAAASFVHGAAVWTHLVAAAQGSETAHVADELEAAAERRIAQGDNDQAATWLLWAADLALSRETRERRLLTAAIQLLTGRRMDRAEPLLKAIEDCAPGALKDCVLGMVSASRGAATKAEALLKAAMHAGPDSGAPHWLKAEAGNTLGASYCWEGHGTSAMHTAQEVLTGSGHVPHLAAPARANLFVGHLLSEGPHAALERFDGEESCSAQGRPTTDGELPANYYLQAWVAISRVLAGQLATGQEGAKQVVRGARSSFADAWIGDVAYYCLAAAQYWLGSWAEAADNAEHTISIALALEHPWACPRTYALSSIIASGRGQWDRAVDHLETSEHWTQTAGPPQFTFFPAMARAFLAQARGDPPGVLQALRPLLDLQESTGSWLSAYSLWWLPLHAEALIGTDRLDEAHRAVERLRNLPTHGRSEELRLAVSWLTGQLLERQGDPAAAAEYRAALSSPITSDDVPLYRARIEQSYGHVVATLGDEASAIELLNRAHRRYRDLGAEPFRQRCQSELSTLLHGSS